MDVNIEDDNFCFVLNLRMDMNLPLLKETGTTSFCDYHITRYWEFRINGHFFGLKRHLKGVIYHYDNDLKHHKKFHVWIEYGGCIAPKELSTDVFREAYNFLVKHTVKTQFPQ